MTKKERGDKEKKAEQDDRKREGKTKNDREKMGGQVQPIHKNRKVLMKERINKQMEEIRGNWQRE